MNHKTSSPILFARLSSWKYAAGLTMLMVTYFCATNPSQGQSAVIMFGSFLLVMVAYVWSAVLMRILAVFLALPTRLQRIGATVVAGVAVFLCLMQSIGQLDPHDALAVVPIAAIIYIYVSRLGQIRTD